MNRVAGTHLPRRDDRERLLRFLLLTPMLPWPSEVHGGAQRTGLIIESLQRLGDVEIVFVHWSEAAVETARNAQVDNARVVGAFCCSRETKPGKWSRLPSAAGRLARTIQENLAPYREDQRLAGWLRNRLAANRYDAIISRFPWPGAAAGLSHLTGTLRVLDWDDLDHLKFLSQVRQTPWSGIAGKLAQSLVFFALSRTCKAAAATYDHVWVAKTTDVTASGARSVSVLPNIPYEEVAIQEKRSATQSIIFVGNQSYLPNAEALSGFLDTAWPTVVRRFPSVRLSIIGPPPPTETAERWRTVDNVEIIGLVPDLAPYYRRATLSICPVQWGGGSNVKAVESLAYGVPCVVSAYTYEAFKNDFSADTGMICAPSADATIDAIAGLLADPDRAAAAGRAGKRVADTLYSRQRFAMIIREGLASAGAAV